MASAKHPPIGPRLRALRLQLRWSQNDLSERSGLRRIEISALESGRNLGSSWRVRTLLAKGFGLKKPELDAYLDGSSPAAELDAKIRPRARDDALVPREPGTPGAAKAPPAGFFSRFPNLREAVRVIAKDAGAEEGLVREVAYRLAANEAADKKIMQWAVPLRDDFERQIVATRINPLRVPNLAAAIRLLAQENPLAERRMKELAALLVAQRADAMMPTTIEWLRALDGALGAEPTPEAPDTKRTVGRRRGSPKR